MITKKIGQAEMKTGLQAQMLLVVAKALLVPDIELIMTDLIVRAGIDGSEVPALRDKVLPVMMVTGGEEVVE